MLEADAHLASPAVVSARGVVKRYGQTVALAGLDAEIGTGITGLLGSNGAGKTTFLSLVLGLRSRDEGDLPVLGEDPASAGIEVRARIGYAPEHHDLPAELAAADLVRHLAELHLLPPRAAVQRANDALWLVGLGEERFRPVGTMSTGQRQRVKLAAAIAHDPELVLLDEPTDGLDPVQRTEMLDLIRRIGSEFGMHIVVSSHHLEEVERICDAVVIVEGGVVVHAGTLADLRRGPDGLVVEVDERADELAALLTDRGLDVTVEGGVLLLAGAAGDHDAVRDAVADLGVGLRRLAPARADARGRLPGDGNVSSGAGRTTLRPRLPGLRGPAARSRAWAILTLAVFTVRRVLGLGRGARHKVLPALTLVIAYVPALVSVGLAALLDDASGRRPDHVRRVHVLHRQRARAVRGARRAGGALPRPALGHARALPRRPARPQPLSRSPRAAAVLAVMLADHARPAALHARRVRDRRASARAPPRRPGCCCGSSASGLATALLYAAVSMAVSSFTTRRAAAAVGVVLSCCSCPSSLPAARSRARGAPDALDLLSFPFVASELSYRIFGELHSRATPIEEVLDLARRRAAPRPGRSPAPRSAGSATGALEAYR